MTTTTDARLTPRIYGASELGVLAVTAPGVDHPRVAYVGAELFVGLNRSGEAITEGEVEGWDRPFDRVVADAVADAADLPPGDSGIVVIDDEALAAAVLLAPDRAAVAGLAGPAVIWVLARDLVVVAGANDRKGVEKVLDLAEARYDSGAPLVSIHPMVVDGQEWAPYDWVERWSDLSMRIHRAIRLFGVRAYEAQSAAIARPDVHVADPKIHVREDGVTVTFVAWPKGVATFLPVADSVLVADPSGSVSVAAFDEFLDAAGDRVTKTGYSPTRYFVAGKKANA